MSLRAIITGCLLLISLLVAAVCLGSVWAIEKRNLYKELDAEVLNSARALTQRVYFSPQGPTTFTQVNSTLDRYLSSVSPKEFLVMLAAPGGTVVNRKEAVVLKPMAKRTANRVYKFKVKGQEYRTGVIKGNHHKIILAFSTSPVKRQVNELLGAITAFLLILLLPLIAGVWWLGRRLSKPLTDMAAQMDAMNSSSLKPIEVPHSPRELEVLGRSFNALLKRVEKAIASQERLVHDISHELRTPLAIARGHLEVSMMSKKPEELKEAAGIAIEEIDRMNQMTAQLLSQARPLKSERFELSEAIQKAVQRLKLLGERDFSLSLRPVELKGDQEAIEQLVVNLLQNALQFSEPGSSIEISLISSEDKAILIIKDQGAGISPELLPHLFERFSKEESSRNRSQGGFGLGLAIAKQIVTAHQGEITAANHPEGGAQFTVKLPLSL